MVQHASFFLEAPWNHRLQLLTQIIMLVPTMVQQLRTSHGIREDSPTYEIGLEHLLNHLPLP
jgi:hypothetical protein